MNREKGILSGLDKAIEEVAALAEYDRLQQRLKDNPLRCPDCGAFLKVEEDLLSPHGVRVLFVSHAT